MRSRGESHDGSPQRGAGRLTEGARIDHTFLLRPGTWRVEGEYRDAGGRAAPVSGESTVKHEEALWRFEGAMRLKGDRPALQHNRYEIEPLTPGARSTHWTSTSEVLGTLRGRFVLCGDAILSFYASPTGRHRGYECLQQVDERRYRVRGAMMEEDKVISTWALELTAA